MSWPRLRKLDDGKTRVEWSNGAYAEWSFGPEPVLIQYSNGERIELKDGKVVAVYAWTTELKKFT